MPHSPRITTVIGCLVFLCTTAIAQEVSGASQHCSLDHAREIGEGANRLFIASNPAFDPYHYVLVDPVYIDTSNALSKHQQARLRTTFKRAIEQDWRERLGWRSSNRAGDQVLRLNIHINDIVVDHDGADTIMLLDVSLSDSLTGQQLMTLCNETLNVSPRLAALDSADGVFWSHLQNSVKHWGAGLGSHIMTPY